MQLGAAQMYTDGYRLTRSVWRGVTGRRRLAWRGGLCHGSRISKRTRDDRNPVRSA